jgi:hypothetical protein
MAVTAMVGGTPGRWHHRAGASSVVPLIARGGSPLVNQDPWAVSADPESAPSSTSPAGPPPRRRRWPIVLLAVLLVLSTAGAVIATVVAVDQRDVAAQWEERALALEAQRDAVDEQRAEVAEQLETALDALTTSERDVGELEDRVRTLADEKARAEDTATTVQVERDVFIELSEVISDATVALDSCVTQLFDLQAASVEAFNRANTGQDVDIDALNARAAEVTRFCNQARTAAANAEAAADRLLRS